MRYSEKIFYEDDKCLITKDRWNYIVREKPIDPQNPYRKATYITDGRNLAWELLDCRKTYSDKDKMPSTLRLALNRALEGKRTPLGMVVVVLAFFIITISLLSFICPAQAEDIDIPTIIQIESNGNPNAYNKSSGAIGLMQITPIVLKEYNKEGIFTQEIKTRRLYSLGDLYVPTINIEIGTWYINERIPQMLKAYNLLDSIDNRLIAYNWGIGNLKNWVERHTSVIVYSGKPSKSINPNHFLPKETQNYIKKYHKLIKTKKEN